MTSLMQSHLARAGRVTSREFSREVPSVTPRARGPGDGLSAKLPKVQGRTSRAGAGWWRGGRGVLHVFFVAPRARGPGGGKLAGRPVRQALLHLTHPAALDCLARVRGLGFGFDLEDGEASKSIFSLPLPPMTPPDFSCFSLHLTHPAALDCLARVRGLWIGLSLGDGAASKDSG